MPQPFEQPVLEVHRLSTLGEFASLRKRWNELAAGEPMRTWEWLEGWWQVYGNVDAPQDRRATGDTTRREAPVEPTGPTRSSTQTKELYLLAAFTPPDHLVAIAPLYIEHTVTHGRVMRWLGTGEVCTDYCDILCEPGFEQAAGTAMAQYLVDPLRLREWTGGNVLRHWEVLELDGLTPRAFAAQTMVGELERLGNLVHRTQNHNCWQLTLPSTWDEYLARLSKSHRKQVRRLEERYLATGRARLHQTLSADEFDRAWSQLVTLHQRRWESLGEPGCFASRRFELFHRDVARRLFDKNMLRLQWVEVDHQPVAAEYHLLGQSTVYAYQGGINPLQLELSPGQLSLLLCIRAAIAEGRRTFDLMRGDETFKPHWRAEPVSNQTVRVLPKSPGNYVRRGLWSAREQVKQWLKGSPSKPHAELTAGK